MSLNHNTYLSPEAEIWALTLEENILSQGENERPDVDTGFPGEDED